MLKKLCLQFVCLKQCLEARVHIYDGLPVFFFFLQIEKEQLNQTPAAQTQFFSTNVDTTGKKLRKTCF